MAIMISGQQRVSNREHSVSDGFLSSRAISAKTVYSKERDLALRLRSGLEAVAYRVKEFHKLRLSRKKGPAQPEDRGSFSRSNPLRFVTAFSLISSHC